MLLSWIRLAAWFSLGVMLFSLGCHDKEPAAVTPTIPQLISFDLNGEFLHWEESDSLVFQPVSGTGFDSGNPDSTLFSFFHTARKEHRQPDSSAWYENIVLVFNQKWLTAAAVQTPSCQELPAGVFAELFSPGDWRWAGWVCPDRLNDKQLYLDLSLGARDHLLTGSTAQVHGCTEEARPQPFSYFRITASEAYDHPLYGPVRMVTGAFEADIFTGQTTLPLRNGRFRLAVRECNG